MNRSAIGSLLASITTVVMTVVTAVFLFAGPVGAAEEPVQPVTGAAVSTQEHQELRAQVLQLENRLNDLESQLSLRERSADKMPIGTTAGALSMLFGAFCALWAQNTRRNTFGWFVIGALGTVLAVLAVLWNNHYDITHPPCEDNMKGL